MRSSGLWKNWRKPSLPTLVASVLVVVGFALSGLAPGFIAIAAAAMFLPGILREMGVLKDKDEFQLQAARRAGYHAYLVGGLFTFLMIAWYRQVEPTVKYPDAFLDAVLIVMWFTWLLSSLFSFWGRVRTAILILLIFGGVWLLFNVISNAFEHGFLATLMQSLLAMPFFLTALLARYYPRVAGVLLLGASVFFFNMFGLQKVFAGDPTLKGRIPVIVLFIGPLIASGIALLGGQMRPEEMDEEVAPIEIA